MAVHQPGTGVIGVEGQCQVASGGKHGDISSGRVVGVQRDGVVKRTATLREDDEVMAVEMDWMALES